MEYFTNRMPKDPVEAYYFQRGYHDAQLEFVTLTEQLVKVLKKRFGTMKDEDLIPNKGLFIVVCRILDVVLKDWEQASIARIAIGSMKNAGSYDLEIEEQSKKLSNYVGIHESYTLMESRLQKIQIENEQLEISNKRLIQQKSDLEKILIKLQNKLDGVN